jgi:hypothetical protein
LLHLHAVRPCWRHSQPWRLPIFPQSEMRHCGELNQRMILLHSPYRQAPLVLTRVNGPAIDQTPRRPRQPKVGLAYIMPSIRASRDRFTRRCSCATEWLLRPAPTGPPPISDRSGLAADQMPPAVAATQSRPCKHHAQHKGLTRRNSRGGWAARRSGCYAVAAQPLQDPPSRTGVAWPEI